MQQQALSEISTLLFSKDQSATGHRSTVPQLECVGGDAKDYYTPDSITCKNLGTHGAGDLSWSCSAQLPIDFKLGSTDVTCEGWSGNGDRTHITQGSCGLRYTLWLTDEGELKYKPSQTSENGRFATIFFFLIFGTILAMILYGIYSSWSSPNPRQRRVRPGSFRPHGGDDDQDDHGDDYNTGFSGRSARNIGFAAASGVAGASLAQRQTTVQQPRHSNTFSSSTGFGSTSMR